MYHSVEARLPFLDYRLLNFALNIKTEHKIFKGWTKYLLRKSIEDKLPNELVWRKSKLGFNAPDNSWINNRVNEMLSTIKESYILAKVCDIQSLIRKYDGLDLRAKWRLYSIALWEKKFNVSFED